MRLPRLLLVVVSSCALAQQEPLLTRYLELQRQHATAPPAERYHVRIEAELPRMHKRGTMWLLRTVSQTGETLYSRIRFHGDTSVERDVIARYLTAETAHKPPTDTCAVDDNNYRITPLGERPYLDHTAAVYRLTPRRRDGCLFRGELWLDTATARPLRMWGETVKSPSRYLRRPYFVLDYATESTAPRMRRLIMETHSLFVGDVKLTIWFDSAREPVELASTQ